MVCGRGGGAEGSRRDVARGRTVSPRSSGRRYGSVDVRSVDRTAFPHYYSRFRGLAIETVLKRREMIEGKEVRVCVRA